MDIITSPTNTIIKTLTQLNNHHYRRKSKQTLLEGMHLVKSWINLNSKDINCLIISQDGLANKEFNLYFNQFKIYVIDKKLWQSLTSLPSDDILAIIDFKDKQFEYSNCGVILDNIQDSGNMGNIIRTSAACGYDFVLAILGANIYSPKVLRSAMGGHLCLKIYQSQNVASIQKILLENQANLYLTSAKSDNNLYNISLKPKHIWIIGNEGSGVHPSWFDIAKAEQVFIPQNKNLESLNAASAAAICLYEKIRRLYENS